jgi:hypothetical protein
MGWTGPSNSRFGGVVSACYIFILVALPVASAAAGDRSSPSIPPQQLIREVVTNELKPDPPGTTKFAYRDHKENAHGSQTELLVEAKETMVGLIVERDGRPLTAQEHENELARVRRFVNDPEELKKKEHREKEDADHEAQIMRALPDAFVYTFAGKEDGHIDLGEEGVELIKLNFEPNPNYVPPTRVEQVLAGMKGFVLIDPRENRLAEIDGTLFRSVEFGWGILGRLEKGGHFIVKQADVGGDHWELTSMDLAFSGKILLVKNLKVHSKDVFSDFRPVPANLTFAEGLELLEKQQSELAQNSH